MPPTSSVRTLMPRRALVSRYHSNKARGSSSSAKKLTGESVADQMAETTSYEPMWHDTASTPLPRALASSRYSMPLTFSSGRMVSTFVRGSIIRSAYALAWLRKLSQDKRRSSRVFFISSGQATFKLYSRRGRANGENSHAKRVGPGSRQALDHRLHGFEGSVAPQITRPRTWAETRTTVRDAP